MTGGLTLAIYAVQAKDKRILQAAEEVFSRHGYEKATLDEIITLADVGKGTVYKYFGNKEQLFYRLVSDRNTPFVKRLQQAVETGESFEQKLKNYFYEMVSFYVANSTLWQIIYFEMLGAGNACRVEKINGEYQVLPRYHAYKITDELKERILRYHSLLHAEYVILYDLIESGVKKGLLKENSVPEIATKFVFFGVAMSIFNPTDDITRKMPAEQAADIIVDHFLWGNSINICKLI